MYDAETFTQLFTALDAFGSDGPQPSLVIIGVLQCSYAEAAQVYASYVITKNQDDRPHIRAELALRKLGQIKSRQAEDARNFMSQFSAMTAHNTNQTKERG